MRKKMLLAPVIALGALTLTASPALAHSGHGGEGSTTGTTTSTHEGAWSGQATLDPLNDSGTSGQAMIELDGNEATVTVNVSGAAETFMDGPFPHAQHIHIASQGVCPTPEADTDGDGAISVPEGHPFYGEIGTSLTTEGDTSADSALAIERFPGGSAYNYERTFELNDATAASLADGTAVMVVHGVDPAKLSAEAQEKPSELDPALPLAATLPAACGTVNVSQMGQMPEGGADTGSPVQQSDTSGIFLGVGALAVAALGGGAWAVSRRSSRA
ncbi:hypothetical protein [Citricoccus muralis]|uniref:CHRD domain-containing protein n=1 Tax=Citricoccus muralis TaxID=169134 RepID=A0A3D9LG89_9MICC|nr:hypothetical protein [Citricoccus muralis]REE05172.1 hypothetical protein C8E99_3043 [Citricoccus muralis]